MNKTKKILLVRFSAMGDVLNITPVIRCLKKQLNAEVHLVTKRSYHALFEYNPYLDKLILLENSWSDLLVKLKSESYDIVIDLHKNIRSYKLRAALGKPIKSFSKEKLNKILFTKFKIDRLTGDHVVHRYFKGLRDIGVIYDGQGLDFFVSDNPIRNPKKPYVLVNLGASKKTKRIPTQLIINLINESSEKYVLIGGKDVSVQSRHIEAESTNSCTNLVGKTSIDQSAKWIMHSKLFITGDTGMMHLAAALKHPMIVLWGPTTARLGLYPLYPDRENKVTNLQHTALGCQPCHHIGFDECPKGHWQCMTHFSSNRLISTINDHNLRN